MTRQLISHNANTMLAISGILYLASSTMVELSVLETDDKQKRQFFALIGQSLNLLSLAVSFYTRFKYAPKPVVAQEVSVLPETSYLPPTVQTHPTTPAGHPAYPRTIPYTVPNTGFALDNHEFHNSIEYKNHPHLERPIPEGMRPIAPSQV